MKASQYQTLSDALTASQYQMLIDALRGGGDREAADAAGATARGTRLDQVWPGTRPKRDIEATRKGEVAVPAHTYEQVVESTELSLPKVDQVWPGLDQVGPGMRPRLDIEGTREGDVAAPAHTYEQVVESTGQSLPKLDQMGPGTRLDQVWTQTRPKKDIKATREGEVTGPAHTYEQVVESSEWNLPKLEQVWPGTRHRLDIEATREGEEAVLAHTADRDQDGERDGEYNATTEANNKGDSEEGTDGDQEVSVTVKITLPLQPSSGRRVRRSSLRGTSDTRSGPRARKRPPGPSKGVKDQYSRTRRGRRR